VARAQAAEIFKPPEVTSSAWLHVPQLAKIIAAKTGAGRTIVAKTILDFISIHTMTNRRIQSLAACGSVLAGFQNYTMFMRSLWPLV
jgi:hypothetical protein